MKRWGTATDALPFQIREDDTHVSRCVVHYAARAVRAGLRVGPHGTVRQALLRGDEPPGPYDLRAQRLRRLRGEARVRIPGEESGENNQSALHVELPAVRV